MSQILDNHRWIARWYEGWKGQPLAIKNQNGNLEINGDYGHDKDGNIQMLLESLYKSQMAISILFREVELLEKRDNECQEEIIKFALAVGLSEYDFK